MVALNVRLDSLALWGRPLPLLFLADLDIIVLVEFHLAMKLVVLREPIRIKLALKMSVNVFLVLQDHIAVEVILNCQEIAPEVIFVLLEQVLPDNFLVLLALIQILQIWSTFHSVWVVGEDIFALKVLLRCFFVQVVLIQVQTMLFRLPNVKFVQVDFTAGLEVLFLLNVVLVFFLMKILHFVTFAFAVIIVAAIQLLLLQC